MLSSNVCVCVCMCVCWGGAGEPWAVALASHCQAPSSLPQVWEGKGVVASARKIIGATNPLAAEPGTIRGDFCVEVSHDILGNVSWVIWVCCREGAVGGALFMV